MVVADLYRRWTQSLSWKFAPSLKRRQHGEQWEAKWSRPDFTAPWLDRPISTEIVTAVNEGWLPKGARVLDAGCGQGEVAAWLADRGFDAVGIDIAPAAIGRARRLFSQQRGQLAFEVLDLCDRPPTGQFDVIIDRGCFHQIPDPTLPRYVKHLKMAATPDARMLLFVRAYRKDIYYGDSAEHNRVAEHVWRHFRGYFSIVHSADTYLDKLEGKDPARARPGIVFWLTRV